MVGQKELIRKINSFTINTLPHSILMLGEKGSEQLDICQYIADRFDLVLYDISELISDEYLNEIYEHPELCLYMIDLMKLDEKHQNIILKFFEEPNPYMYIILLSESKFNILETIQTRSYELVMDKYTTEELEPLVTNNEKDLLLSIARTPGTVEELNYFNLSELKLLCENIVDKLSVANFQNTLTISDKINFKDEYEKYPLWAFIKMLSIVLLEKCKPNMYFLLNDFSKKVGFLLDKKRYFENLLINMWLEAGHGH